MQAVALPMGAMKHKRKERKRRKTEVSEVDQKGGSDYGDVMRTRQVIYQLLTLLCMSTYSVNLHLQIQLTSLSSSCLQVCSLLSVMDPGCTSSIQIFLICMCFAHL